MLKNIFLNIENNNIFMFNNITYRKKLFSENIKQKVKIVLTTSVSLGRSTSSSNRVLPSVDL